MPNYSPVKNVFSSIGKDITKIPFADAHYAYREAVEELLADKQADLDHEYEQEIAQMEQDYCDSHEAPYEGNFRDSHTCKVASAPIEAIDRAATARIKLKFIDPLGIAFHTDWIMESIISLLGRMPTEKNSNGLISGKRFKQQNFPTDWLKGVYRFVTINYKSAYLKDQYKAPNKSYAALVPIILYAQRLARGTPYSAWDPEELHEVMHYGLADAMTHNIGAIPKDTLIELRTEGLTVKSGQKKGTLVNGATAHRLTGITNERFKKIPELAQVMLTQIWCAHPDNRTKYMVLDPSNWDTMPPALIARDVMPTESTSSARHVTLNTSW